jgi:hypothetical protein
MACVTSSAPLSTTASLTGRRSGKARQRGVGRAKVIGCISAGSMERQLRIVESCRCESTAGAHCHGRSDVRRDLGRRPAIATKMRVGRSSRINQIECHGSLVQFCIPGAAPESSGGI